MTKTLPAGTYFPWHHFRLLQAAAVNGNARISNSVFTGESLENDPTLSATQFLAKAATSEIDLSHAEDLRGKLPDSLWRFTIAVFATPADPLPLYEISGVSTLEGVIVQGKIIYPELTLALKLQKLEWLPAETCG